MEPLPARRVLAAAALCALASLAGANRPAAAQSVPGGAPAAAGLAARMTAYADRHAYPLSPAELRDILEKTSSPAGVLDEPAALAELARRVAARGAGAAAAVPAPTEASLNRLFENSSAGADAAVVAAGAPAAARPSGLLKPAPAAAVPAAPAADPAGDSSRRVDAALKHDSADEVIGLKDADLAAAAPQQKVALLKVLIGRANQPQNGNDDPGPSRSECETALLRILGSAPDDAAFDRMYYRIDPSNLSKAFSDMRPIRDLVARHQAGAKPGDWAGLGRYIDGVADAKSSGKNRVEFLIDNGVIAPATAALEGAKKSIHIEVFQLQADEVGWTVAKLLAAKAKAGVRVRVMVDANGSQTDFNSDVGQFAQIHKLLDSMEDAGVQVIVRQPPLDQSHLDHRKVLVIDGDTAFTGGMNIGKSYQVDWHDQQTLIMGPAVAALQKAFLDRWTKAGGKVPPEELDALFPPLAEQGGSEVRVVGHVGGAADQNIKAMYLRAFLTAEHSIRIANPYFLDQEIIAMLIARAKAGVKVQVVLPEDNDVAIVKRGSRAFYPDLLKAGVEIYEYQGRMAHDKVCVIDGRWATAGSSNLDARSLRFNDELNIAIDDPEVAQYISRHLFDADLKNSKRVESYSPTWRERLDRWLGRGL